MSLLKQILPAGALALACAARAQTAPVDISYEKQIYPLLESYCLDCHGADDADGGFALDTFAALMKGGEEGVALVPGKSAESLLVKFLEGKSGREGKNQFMPPGKRDKMKPEEIALIKAWIDAGAKGPVMADAKPAPRQVITPKIAPSVTPRRAIQAVAYSPTVKLVAVARHGEVELTNPVSRAVVRKLTGFTGKVNAVAFSPDGALVYAAGGEPGIAGEVRSWKTADGAIVQSFVGHADAAYALAVSPDGKVLATGAYDQKIRLWDTTTGKEKALLSGHNGAVFGLAFRPDGQVLASASADRTVKLWSVPSAARLDTLSQPLKEQTAVVFSRDGKHLFAAGQDNRIRVWSVSMAAKEGTNTILTSRYAHEGGILGLALSADGALLASSAVDRSMKLWNPADLTEKLLLEKQPDWAPALAFDEKSQLITGRVDGSLGVYEPVKGAVVMAPKPKPPAKLVQPQVTRIEPRGMQAGSAAEIVVLGTGITGNASIKATHAGLKVELVPGSIMKGQLTARVTAAADLPRGAYDLVLSTPGGGSSAPARLHVDDVPVMTASADAFKQGPVQVKNLPSSLFGTLTETGQHDVYRFHARAGEELVFDLAVAQLGSKAKTPTLEITDAQGVSMAVNRGLDSGSDPFLSWKAPVEGDYMAIVSNTTMDGGPEHVYRLTMGALPYATAWRPLSVPIGQESVVHLVGSHLAGRAAVKVHPAQAGSLPVPVGGVASAVRFRGNPVIRATALPHAEETEGNDDVKSAQSVSLPMTVNGVLGTPGDVDCFSFEAKQGETWIVETLAAMAGSPADTKIEILQPDGRPVPRLLLQAVRDSYNNFRSVDANNPDIRLQNWEEMELNEYVYFNGDVMKTFRMPRGPDSGFLFYTREGKRRAYFDTSATSHALDEPCYTVVPQPLNARLVPNGLPVLTLAYANDDAGDRALDRDSRLTFTAPATGRYVARVTDTRAWGGPRFVYALTLRQPAPDFTVKLAGMNPTVGAGGSVGFSIEADRLDGFDGPVDVTISGVPAGFQMSSPLRIEAGHTLVNGSLRAAPGARSDADWSKLRITATASIGGRQVAKTPGSLGKVTVGPAPKFIIVLEPDAGGKPVMRPLDQQTTPLELTLAPGGVVRAWLRVVRQGDDGLINLDVHNLPHGVIVDDIGLNGVQIRPGENDRPIVFRAAKWVQEQDRLCHGTVSSARAEQDSAGIQSSYPVLLKVRRPAGVAGR